MKHDIGNAQTIETVEWLEKKIKFIKTCFPLIKEVNIFNRTEVVIAKKYYRIYIEIVADLPEIKKPLNELNEFEYEVVFFSTTPEYFYYPSRGLDENYVILNYQWICKILKIRLKDSPFNLDLKDYIKETDSYYSQFD